MSWLADLFDGFVHLLREPGALLDWGGYAGLALIIFLETGALVFFLPGDSLLVVAGLYAAKGDFHIALLIALLVPMAIIGDACSYVIGKRAGPLLFHARRGRWLRPERLEAAAAFYERHGGKAIILARFVPLARTFVPVVAGMARMPYRRFAAYNVIGAAAWIVSMTLVGYLLGRNAPGIVQHMEKVILVVVVLSITPAVIEYLRARRARPAAGPALAPERDEAAP